MPVPDDVRDSATGGRAAACCGVKSRSTKGAMAGEESGPLAAPSPSLAPSLLALPEGVFRMGSSEQRYPADDEGPPRTVRVEGFRIAAYAISNDDFAAFVRATGYFTTAERTGWSFVFGGLLPDDFPPTRAVAAAPWWRQVSGACWHRPEGGTSDVHGREDHPVVHVSDRG